MTQTFYEHDHGSRHEQSLIRRIPLVGAVVNWADDFAMKLEARSTLPTDIRTSKLERILDGLSNIAFRD